MSFCRVRTDSFVQLRNGRCFENVFSFFSYSVWERRRVLRNCIQSRLVYPTVKLYSKEFNDYVDVFCVST